MVERLVLIFFHCLTRHNLLLEGGYDALKHANGTISHVLEFTPQLQNSSPPLAL